MDTTFTENEAGHLAIHGDLAAFYNRLNGFDPGSVSTAAHLYGKNYGMGDGRTADGTAFQNAIAAALSAQTFGDRTAQPVLLELPPGTFKLSDGRNGAGNVLTTKIQTQGGGDLIIQGQGKGVTVLQAPGNVTAGTLTVASTSRTGTAVSITTTANHGLAVGDPLAVPIVSRKVTTQNHYTVASITNATTFVLNIGAAGDDAFKPANGAVITKLGFFLEPLGWSTARRIVFRDLSIIGNGNQQAAANNPVSPSVGIGIRANARVEMANVAFAGWWIADAIWGGPHNGNVNGENNDHNVRYRCDYNNNRSHRACVSNMGTDGVPNAGTRDIWDIGCQSGAAQHSWWTIGDSGCILDYYTSPTHVKSAPYPFYMEGVEGVAPGSTNRIDTVRGEIKIESPGTCALFWDESRKGNVQNFMADVLNKVSLTVNGDGHTNASDQTFKPWTGCTASITSNVETITGLPTGHGLRVGDHIAVGLTNTGVDGAMIVETTATNQVTCDRPDAGANVGNTTVIVGMIGGQRVGSLDACTYRWYITVDGTSKMTRPVFWWNYDVAPNACEITYIANTGGGGANADNDLPSVRTENSLGHPSRTYMKRGINRYVMKTHDSGDTNAIAAGNCVELSTTGQVKQSTGVKTHLFEGVAMQASPASGATSVGTSGSGSSARSFVNRPILWVALPNSVLSRTDDPTGIATTGTVNDGDVLVDNADGTVATWNGSTTGKRVIGTALENATGNLANAALIAPYWT